MIHVQERAAQHSVEEVRTHARTRISSGRRPVQGRCHDHSSRRARSPTPSIPPLPSSAPYRHQFVKNRRSLSWRPCHEDPTRPRAQGRGYEKWPCDPARSTTVARIQSVSVTDYRHQVGSATANARARHHRAPYDCMKKGKGINESRIVRLCVQRNGDLQCEMHEWRAATCRQ